MDEPGTVLYCNLFVAALYSDHWVEVKPRSLTKTDFDSSVGESCEMSCIVLWRLYALSLHNHAKMN